jgi:hypothetical protein
MPFLQSICSWWNRKYGTDSPSSLQEEYDLLRTPKKQSNGVPME